MKTTLKTTTYLQDWQEVNSLTIENTDDSVEQQELSYTDDLNLQPC